MKSATILSCQEQRKWAIYRENGVAVADYTVHIIFCPLEHVPEAVRQKHIAPIRAMSVTEHMCFPLVGRFCAFRLCEY